MPIIFSLVVFCFCFMLVWLFIEGYAQRRNKTALALRARTGVCWSLYACMFFIGVEFIFLIHNFMHPFVHSGGRY